MTNVNDDVMTAQQVARMFGLTRATICLAAKKGELRHTLKLPGVNGAYLFDLASVKAWRTLPDSLDMDFS